VPYEPLFGFMRVVLCLKKTGLSQDRELYFLFCFTQKGTFMIKSLNLRDDTPNFALVLGPRDRRGPRVSEGQGA
jgi:hypothetical protein